MAVRQSRFCEVRLSPRVGGMEAIKKPLLALNMPMTPKER